MIGDYAFFESDSSLYVVIDTADIPDGYGVIFIKQKKMIRKFESKILLFIE